MKKVTTADFASKAKEQHSNKYSYEESVYTGVSNKLTIICPIHGRFNQKPQYHLRGSGCLECGKIISRQTIIDLAKKTRLKYTSNIENSIILNTGDICLVDKDRYEYLNSFNWSKIKGANTLYACGRINGKEVYMHRYIMDVYDGDIQIDHVDGNGLNNQIDNLRICTKSQNQMNRRKNPKHSSKFKGVCWDKNNKRWACSIRHEGKTVYLGRFDVEQEAAIVYDTNAKFFFGEFAKLNFPSL